MFVFIVVTFDLGRVTTAVLADSDMFSSNCGDVRSRTSYNIFIKTSCSHNKIVVTFDLGRVTTKRALAMIIARAIVVTFDLGRVTTSHINIQLNSSNNCGDVRSRTSYN